MPLYKIRDIIKKAVKATLINENVDAVCVVNVLATNDDTIKKYNKNYRGIDKATDVLSFPMQDFKKAGWGGCTVFEPDEDSGNIPLGDIVVSSETIKRYCEKTGVLWLYELTYMIIHSTLHLLGYDHITKKDEKLMFYKNKIIMQEMGFDADDK